MASISARVSEPPGDAAMSVNSSNSTAASSVRDAMKPMPRPRMPAGEGADDAEEDAMLTEEGRKSRKEGRRRKEEEVRKGGRMEGR